MPTLSRSRNVLAEIRNRQKSEQNQERPFNYVDASSTLILMLFEMTIILDAPEIYDHYRDYFVNAKVDLQIFHPMKDDKTELRLFEK
jgi:hypothetical protein